MHLSFHCLKVNIPKTAMDGRVFVNETMVQPTHVTGYTVFLVLLSSLYTVMTEKFITG